MSEKGIKSRKWRQSHLYNIIDLQSQKVVFKRNEAQEELKNQLEILRQKKNWLWLRVLILKWRQLWITTDACISWIDTVCMRPNQNYVITAHEQDKQQEIFDKVKFAYDNIPDVKMVDWKRWVKPKSIYYTKSKIVLKHWNNNKSKIQVLLNSRSWTLSHRHITEIAFRDDAEDMMTWSLPSVPLTADVISETTANWVGNFFHQLRENNYNNPDWAWDCIFLAWYWWPQYSIPLGPWEVIELPRELNHLNNIITHKWVPLTDEQKKRYIMQWKLFWRKVFQEYPSTPEEAFLNTWDTVIDKERIEELKPHTPKVISEPMKWLRIYRNPDEDEDKVYFRWVDTATWSEKWDFSCIEIRDKNYKLYAHLYAKIPAEELVRYMDYLWNKWYISANMWVERNGVGMATITEAKHYPWHEYIYNSVETDSKTMRPSKKYWIFTGTNRKGMIENLVWLIRNKDITEFDDRTISEMYKFIYATGQRPEAMKWCHDDAIMTSVFCCWTIETRLFI